MKKATLFLASLLGANAQILSPIFFQNTATPPALVQRISAAAAYTPTIGSTTPETTAVTFGGSVTAGNTILVHTFLRTTSAGGSTSTYSVTDPDGDTYTQIFQQDAGNQSGGATGVYCASGVTAGAHTVTFHWTANVGGTNAFSAGLTVEEFSNFTSCASLTHATQQIFGAAGNAPVDLTITDSHNISVTVRFSGSAGTGGPGTDTAIQVTDFVENGKDFLFASVGNGTTPAVAVVSPSGYQVFTDPGNGPTGSLTANVFKPQ